VFGVGLDRWLLLVLVALFVLGPERLPAAMGWVGRTVRQVKSYAAGAQERLHSEIGPELAELRKPFEELRKPLADLPLAELRRLRNPRAAVVDFLFTDHTPPGASSSTRPGAGVRLAPGERPPTDPEAT
jgi:sec-independent protein translocase protein TatB